MTEKSGADALIDALKKSGVDVNKSSFAEDSQDGGNKSSGKYQGAAGAGGSRGADSSRASSGMGGMESIFTTFFSGGGGSGPGNTFFRTKSNGNMRDRFTSMKLRSKIGAILLALIVIACAYWWFHPPLNIQSPDTWGIITVVCVATFLFFGGTSVLNGYIRRKEELRARRRGITYVDTEQNKGAIAQKLCLIPVVILLMGIIGWIMSLSVFPGNAEKYSSILKTENLDFITDLPQVDYSQIPVIDHDTAEILGDKQMGTIAEYVSQFEVDSLYSQINFQGQPVRVSPLNYADLFKWFTNRSSGIPAYAVVNMTTQDVQIVRLSSIEGAPEGIKYSTSEPLARNIDRFVQLKYPFYMFDTKSFEIDETGHPWWICPVQEKTIGLFGGTTISRVVMCDAVTGECQDLPVGDVPQWVDRAYPSDLLIQQYNWYGTLNNGWLNSWVGQQGVVKTTPGTGKQLGYNYLAKNDDVWVYTGVTSATSDSSIIGFVLVNQRTAESHFYSVAGATEKSAMESAEGQVQHLRYSATFPILINIANQPTYFMALKDSAGTVKKFAMLDIQRYQNVAVGDTVLDCQKNYESLLATNGIEVSDSNDIKKTTGIISRMAQAVIEGNSHYYVSLQDSKNIYDFAFPSMLRIVSYAVGDTISFSYIEGGSTCCVQEIFDSSSVSETKSE